jgi:Uma2 family endonuclease
MATIKTRLTADEYSKLPETTQQMELIDGEIIVSPAPLDYHQEIILNVASYLKILMDKQGHIRVSPVDIQLDEYNILKPDLMWVSGPDSLCQRDFQSKRWYGSPDLVCEILVPATVSLDKIKKFSLYEKHGTRELWLLNAANQFVEVYSRQDDKLILLDVAYNVLFSSPLLQHEIDTNAIFSGANA